MKNLYSAEAFRVVRERLDKLRDQILYGRTENEFTVKDIDELYAHLNLIVLSEQKENAKREARELGYSWLVNPDKSGGQFTQEEINRGNEWR